jgi:malate dehydrogenase
MEVSMRSKVTIIGAGNTGSATAIFLAAKDICDIVLLDVIPGRARGKAMDLQEAIPILGQSTCVAGTEEFKDTAGSAVVVITAGCPRKPGMTRDELALVNARVVADTVRRSLEHSPDAILIVLTNPVDAMSYLAYKVSGLPKHRVLGQAGVLDTARFQMLIAQELGVSVESVNTVILGGHGDTMVPMVRHTTIGGVPLLELLPEEKVDALMDRAKNRGTEIVNLLQTSASYAPGAALAAMVQCLVQDSHRVLPCSAYCEGEFGLSGLFFGVPVQIGRAGVERIVELPLNDEEQGALQASAEKVRSTVSGLASFYP